MDERVTLVLFEVCTSNQLTIDELCDS